MIKYLYLPACLAMAIGLSIGVSAEPAGAAGTPGWSLAMSALPTNFAPGSTHDKYIIAATNDGDAPTTAAVTITDDLAAGLQLEHISGYVSDTGKPLLCPQSTLTCSTQYFGGQLVVTPGDTLVVIVEVSVAAGAPSTVSNSATVVGGGALASASANTATAISSSPAPFGIVDLSAQATNADGTLDTQAGSHPYEATTTFELASHGMPPGELEPSSPLKDLEAVLPAGFVANPQATPQCAQSEFQHPNLVVHLTCPMDSQIGQVRLLFPSGGYREQREEIVPLYNLAPVGGHTAELGFYAEGYEAPIVLVAQVRRGQDYRVAAKVSNISSGIGGTPIGVVLSSLTLWGAPAESSHNAQRGLYCHELDGTHHVCAGDEGLEHEVPAGAAPLGQPSGAKVVPFVTDPSSCREALATTLSVDSWQEPGTYLTATAPSPTPTGCGALAFDPSLTVSPETSQAGEASGYGVDLQVPQSESPTVLATPDLEKAVVTLPEGVSISPSAASGLQGCSDEQIGIGSEAPVACPAASKVGTVTVTTPLLAGPLEGLIYVGDPLPGDPYRIFLTVEGFGVSVRLEGRVHADPSTGRLTTTFEDNPQLPFSDLHLQFFGGPQAVLSNPSGCGTATTTSELTPWSAGAGGSATATPGSSFQVSFDGDGASCSSSQPFAPTLSAGSESTQAAAFSPFTLTLSRTDADQDLEGLTVHPPPGLLGMLSKVSLCPEPQAEAGTCGPESLIGSTTVGAGAGPDPFYLGGQVYLTGPYKGAPFGLSVVVPAIAGPYNLGTVVVRATVNVDPTTAALTITSDPFPHILQGIPLQLRTINVTINRPGFMFNPTNCSQRSVAATVASTEGASASVSSPFAAQGCADLPFKPVLTASTQAQTSKADGASLNVKVTSGAGQANIAKVDLQLPIALPSRLTTLQKACTEAQFNANPAACPAASVIGTAKAVTPVLNVPLTGPAILVSHGGAAFPDVEFILQGQGVTIVLDGKTQIKGGITYSRFETVPDAPISSFEAVLPEGPHSILATNLPAPANNSTCGQTLTMPTTITAQNGAQITQQTKIVPVGCSTKPTVKITKTVLRAGALLVTVSTSAQGRVRISGQGLKTTVRKGVGSGRHQIKVALTKTGKTDERGHKKVELRASLTVGKQAAAMTSTVKL